MVTPQTPSDPVYQTRYQRFCQGDYVAAFKFPLSLKQDGSASLATWHVQIPDKIITELSVRRSDHQETGGDLEGARLPPDWGGLMPYVQSANIDIHSAWRKANDRVLWWRIIDTTTLRGICHWRREEEGVESIAVSVSVCLSVCMSLHWPYLKNQIYGQWRDIHIDRQKK